MTELLRAAEGSPLLLAFLVVGGFLSYAVERLCGAAGPAVRLARVWRDRELRKLRHEALVRAERRRIDREDAAAVEADLIEQRDHLRRRVRDLADERDQLGRQLDLAHRRLSAARPTLPVPRLDGDDPDTAPLRRESARHLVPGR